MFRSGLIILVLSICLALLPGHASAMTERSLSNSFAEAQDMRQLANILPARPCIKTVGLLGCSSSPVLPAAIVGLALVDFNVGDAELLPHFPWEGEAVSWQPSPKPPKMFLI